MDVIEKLEALREGVPSWDFSRISAFTDVIIEVKRLRAEVAWLRTPDMFWDEYGGDLSGWADALNGAQPFELRRVGVAHGFGYRTAVRIPIDGLPYGAQSLLFATDEEAEAAVAKAKGVG